MENNMNQSPQSITVRTPAKIILSGEHAVVYGKPALAMAINRYVETTIQWRSAPSNILFNLLSLSYHQTHSIRALRRLKTNIQKKYQKFLQGEYGIRDVLGKPFELLQYAVSQFIDKRSINLPRGVEIHTDSNIPIGCGMGSSAASVVSVMHAFASFCNLDFDLDHYFQMAKETENLQHGRSSGIDLYLALHGGCVRFENGLTSTRPIPQIPMLLVNTGIPESSTGECVALTAPFFQQSNLADDFAKVTNNFDIALQNNHHPGLLTSIRDNHQLLISIGIVPSKVQKFIEIIESMGAAAKICGAGTTQGDKAGIVMIFLNEKNEAEDILSICQEFDYQSMNVQGEIQGTSIINK